MQTITRNAAVVRKRTTAVYRPKAAAIYYLNHNVCHSDKSRSRSVKIERLQRLPHNVCHSAKYERSS